MSSALPGPALISQSPAGSHPPTASRSAQAFDRRQNLARRLLPLLSPDDQAPISTTDLGRRLGLTGRDRDQLLWPVLDRLAHAGLTLRTRRGRTCSWSQTPLLAYILAALHPTIEITPRSGGGLTENLPLETVDTAVAALAWCGLVGAPTSGQTSASRAQSDPDTTPASSTSAEVSALAGPPTVRAVAIIGRPVLHVRPAQTSGSFERYANDRCRTPTKHFDRRFKIKDLADWAAIQAHGLHAKLVMIDSVWIW